MTCPRRHNFCEPLQRNHCIKGFTLLELLVVMSILTLIMTASFGAIRLGTRSLAAGITQADETEQVRATADFLRRRFAQLATIVDEINAEPVVSFSGDQQRIRFIAPAPQHAENAGLFVYKLTTLGRYNEQSLLLTYAPYDPGSGNFAVAEDAQQLVLVEHLSEIRFEFFGENYEREAPAWYGAWSGEQAGFPQMIRIRLATAKSRADWPDLTFAIRVEDQS